jgi:hypothetical protein
MSNDEAVRRTHPTYGRFASLKIVRESSVAGPCVTLGHVLRETGRRISYRDRHGTRRFISKRWAVHTDPCPLCPDHPTMKYSDGHLGY